MAIRTLSPTKTLPTLENIALPATISAAFTVAVQPVSRPMSVPTAAALKMGVGFPLTNLPGIKEDANRVLSTQCQNKGELLHECGICKHINDQHLLAKCDTCHLHYHLGCLNPPLTRHPKKSKIYAWQCSECDEDNPDGVVPLTTGPRKSRTKYSKDGTIVPVDSSRDASLENIRDDDRTLSSPASPTSGAMKRQKSTLPIGNKKSANKKVNKSASESQSSDEKVNNAEIIIIPAVKSPESFCILSDTSDRSKSPIKRREVKKKQKSKSKVNSLASPKSPEVTMAPINNIVNGNAEIPIKTEHSNAKLKIKLNKEEKIISSPAVSTSQTPIESVANVPKAPTIISSPAATTSITTPTVNPYIESQPNSPPHPHPPKVTISKKSKKLHVSKIKTENGEFDGIAMAASLSIPRKILSPPVDSTEVPLLTNGTKSMDENDATHKQNRKRRKEKRRSKHSSDRERSPSKEHKKKRKRKNHDVENPNAINNAADGVPKIKIKVSACSLYMNNNKNSYFYNTFLFFCFCFFLQISSSRQCHFLVKLQQNHIVSMFQPIW